MNTEGVAMSMRTAAAVSIKGINTGDYVSKLEYAAMRKRFEGDVEYADALKKVGAVLELIEDDADAPKDGALLQARRELSKIIEARSCRASYRYHDYTYDFVADTLPEYNPDGVEGKPAYAKITLEKPYFRARDAKEIGDLLGLSADEVLKMEAADVRERLVALGLSDHPERYVFQTVVVPFAFRDEVMKTAYDNLLLDKARQTTYLNLLFGESGADGILNEVMRDESVRVPFRNSCYVAYGYIDFGFPCFGDGGEFASEQDFAKTLKGEK